MDNKELKPKIRFKGYDCSADDIKFSEIIDKKIDNRGFTPNFYIKGKHPLIEVAAVGERKPNYKNVVKYLDDNAFDNQLREYIQENDILYSTVGSVGEVTLMDDNKMAAIAQNIVGFRCKASFDSKYIYSLLSTEKSRRIANSIVMSAVQPSIKVPQLLKCVLNVTSDVKEQKLIGDFFENIDSLIKQSKEKVEKWKNIRTAFLSKIFPKPGSRVPELRFKGFSGEWEEKQLREIGSPYNGLSGKNRNDFGHGEGKYIPYLNIFNNPIVDINNLERIEIDNTQNTVKKNDIFFTVSSETPDEVGMASVWLGNSENIYLNSFCFGFRPMCEINPFYITYLLRSNYFRKQITLLAQGISRFNISKTKVGELMIVLPTLEEQSIIGNFIYKLDNNIIMQQQKLEKLKQIKQSFLSKMFV